MRLRLLLAVLPLLLAACQTAPEALRRSASPPIVSVQALRSHIDVLASDAFEGRAPGTAGEAKSLDYIRRQFEAVGLEPAGRDGTWLQPVPLIDRRRISHDASFTARGRRLPFDNENLILIGRETEASLIGAPVMVLGAGATIEELSGAVVLIPFSPHSQDRAQAAARAGAAAVLTLIPGDVAWSGLRAYLEQRQTSLDAGMPITGLLSPVAARALVAAAGADLDGLLAAARPGRTGVTATFEVRSDVRAYTSYNIVGRLRGSGNTGESLLFLAHWDHLGICAPDAADRICNGAVDNASGIAMLIEVARALASGPRPTRDVLFMGTTAEESGLLGAHHFAADPTVPLASIVAAINIDTVAIHHAGEPVAVIGRGLAPLDALIAETAADVGRRLDQDGDADSFVERQDGYALAQAGVPAVMVGGSFANMNALNAFLRGAYHKPDDDLNREIILDGAAEDTTFLVELARKLADPARYVRP